MVLRFNHANPALGARAMVSAFNSPVWIRKPRRTTAFGDLALGLLLPIAAADVNDALALACPRSNFSILPNLPKKIRDFLRRTLNDCSPRMTGASSVPLLGRE